MAGAQFDISRDVVNIISPTLVIHGANDRYVPLANASALAEAIPKAKLCVIDEAGHLVFIEKAEEVNEEIVSFLKPPKARQKRRPRRPTTQQKTETPKFIGTIQRLRLSLSGWASELRDWLSR